MIEVTFLVIPPKERMFEPWEFITIEQKISYEDELFREIGKGKGKPKGLLNFLKPKKHKLSEYEFNAKAKLCRNDDVLFTVSKKGEIKFDYAVIHLTWKGKFDYFLNYQLHPDKRDWEE